MVRAESLRFRREGVQGVVRDVFIPWYNAFRFLVQNVLRLEASGRLPRQLLPFRPAQVKPALPVAPERLVWEHWLTWAFTANAALCDWDIADALFASPAKRSGAVPRLMHEGVKLAFCISEYHLCCTGVLSDIISWLPTFA